MSELVGGGRGGRHPAKGLTHGCLCARCVPARDQLPDQGHGREWDEPDLTQGVGGVGGGQAQHW